MPASYSRGWPWLLAGFSVDEEAGCWGVVVGVLAYIAAAELLVPRTILTIGAGFVLGLR